MSIFTGPCFCYDHDFLLIQAQNIVNLHPLQPVEVVDYLPSLRPPSYQPTDEPQRNCAYELFLPDQAFLMGRLMLAAWECGLEGANDSAADVLVCAVQVKLLITKKKNFLFSNF